MKDEFNIVVIGAGHLGAVHAKLWKENTKAKLLGIFDTDRERSRHIADTYSCISYASMEDAISSCDALTIASPTVSHYEIALEAIKQGKHCLIEKPITSTYEQALKLIEEAEKSNVIIQVGHVERFNPALAAVMNYDIQPKFIEAHRLSQFRPRATDVSVIHDLMIHDIDIMLWLVKDKVKKIDASGVSILTDTPDICNARITFENGCVANLTASRISANPMRKLRFFQKDAYISIDFGKPEVEVFRLLDNGDKPEAGVPAAMIGAIEQGSKNKNIYYEKPDVTPVNAIAEEQYSFFDSITNGRKIAVNAHEAAEALKVAEEIKSLLQ